MAGRLCEDAGVAGRWSSEQVLALAPDASSAAAGRRLAAPGPWTATGASLSPAAVWGVCAGSGSTPYQTVIDLSEPAFRCSCPSRKFPCKHALGLLLLWSAGAVTDQAQPGAAAAEWLATRAERAAKRPAAQGTPNPGDDRASGGPADPEAAAQRAAQREQRVAAGVADLDQWLADRIRTGLAGAERAGYGYTDQVAARLVDAQAPGLAGAVRRLGSVAASGEGWAGRLLTELALIRLLTTGHARLAQLPEPLAATIRSRIGYPIRTKDVLATPPLRDRWTVLSLQDEADDRLIARRVHLHGAQTQADAIVLSFSAGGQPLDSSLVPGTSLDADLHFYPGAFPLRALVGTRHSDPGPIGDLDGASLAGVVTAWASALAADPWITELPIVISGVVPAPPPPGAAGSWYLTGRDGDAVPLRSSDSLWTLLSISGGHPVTVAGAYTPGGMVAAAVHSGDRMVAL
jgi:hypothetical protein